MAPVQMLRALPEKWPACTLSQQVGRRPRGEWPYQRKAEPSSREVAQTSVNPSVKLSCRATEGKKKGAGMRPRKIRRSKQQARPCNADSPAPRNLGTVLCLLLLLCMPMHDLCGFQPATSKQLWECTEMVPQCSHTH
jgi:hypothetical protein